MKARNGSFMANTFNIDNLSIKFPKFGEKVPDLR
jgi:hypothetical protein